MGFVQLLFQVCLARTVKWCAVAWLDWHAPAAVDVKSLVASIALSADGAVLYL
jgi:hypothetical protein